MFEYNHNLSAEDNFVQWYAMNCEERDLNNEPLLDSKSAIALFNQLYVVAVEKNKLKRFI